MALVAPSATAVACLIDVGLIDRNIYRRPSDGPIVSGLFCIVPCVFLLPTSLPRPIPGVIDMSAHIGWTNTCPQLLLLPILSGVFYFLHLYCYFRALFMLNDSSCAEIFNTLSVLLVPVLAFALLGELLGAVQGIAIMLAAGSVMVLIRHQLTTVSKRWLGTMVVSVLAVSVSMVCRAWSLEHMPWSNSIGLFSLTVFTISVVSALLLSHRGSRYLGLLHRYIGVFVIAESFQLIAILASHRAISIGPSVSLVAVLGCALPLMIMLFSLIVIGASKVRPFLSNESFDAFALQIKASPEKLACLFLIFVSILIVQSGIA